jgi:hypothetical protein
MLFQNNILFQHTAIAEEIERADVGSIDQETDGEKVWFSGAMIIRSLSTFDI